VGHYIASAAAARAASSSSGSYDAALISYSLFYSYGIKRAAYPLRIGRPFAFQLSAGLRTILRC
jgi:hypothetical protein